MIAKFRALDVDGKFMVVLLIVIAALLVLAGFGIKAAIEAEKEWRAWCVGRGGVVLEDSSSKNTVSYDAKGNPVVGIATTAVQLCVVDGDVIDVRTT